MTLDDQVAAIVRREVTAALAPVVERLEQLVTQAQAAQPAKLLPLCEILGCSPRAALARLSRDPELRELGHRLGRRLVFRAHEVQHLLAERQRERASLNGGGA